MVSIAIATDNMYGTSNDSKTLNSVISLLKAKGHTVTSYGIGPNKVQRNMLKKSNSCDMMIQIAGGKCLGTLADFHAGIKQGYYHAKTGGFMYYKCYDANWKAVRAHDDKFSPESLIRPYKGKTLPEIYNMMKPYCFFGYGNSAEELVSTFLNNYNGTGGNSSTSTGSSGDASNTGNSGGNALELIKQVLIPYDMLGVEILLNGDTVKIQRSNPDKALSLNENNIVNNSISFEEYDPNTPNTLKANGKTVTDDRLVNMYGTVAGESKGTWTEQELQVLKRGHGHSIDCKTLINPEFTVGKWVRAKIPSLNIDNLYYITKNTLDDERQMGITLEPAPPSRLVEIKETSTTGSTSSTSSNAKTGRICSIISKVGGVPITDYKSLYENFKKMVYKYYNNDIYSLDTELSRAQQGLGMNCADLAQLYYNAYKEAGFSDEIQIVRGVVNCSSGSYGHIWCRVKSGGSWVLVDPSAAAKYKYNIGKFICGSGYVTNINPAWAVSDDGRT